MVTYKFDTLLADSRALVTATCEIDIDDDYVDFTDVVYEGNSVYDVLSDNQWTELEWDALKSYKEELVEQETIDYDLESPLKAVYGLSKPSFHIG
jgi:uncharacterized membrane protein